MLPSNKTTDMAVVEAQWSMAKMFPRDREQARERIASAAKSIEFSKSAHYLYKRGNSEVKGPTIRSAEEMARSWGNLSFGYRITEQDEGSSTVEAFCLDMESNTKQERVFRVSHTRNTKRGSYLLRDPRDIAEAVGATAMRHVRGCILSMIPADIVEMLEDQCNSTIRESLGDLGEARQRMISAFSELGVPRAALMKESGKDVESLNAYDILRLRRIWVSIKEGYTPPHDWFDVPERRGERRGEQSSVSKLEVLARKNREKLSQDQAKALDAPAVESAPEPPTDPAPATAVTAPAPEPEPAPEPQARAEPVPEPASEPVLQLMPSPEPDPESAPARQPTKNMIGRIRGAYARAGITVHQIEYKLNKRLDDITKEDVDQLRQELRDIKAKRKLPGELGFVPEVKSSDVLSQETSLCEQFAKQIIESTTVADLTQIEEQIDEAEGALKLTDQESERLSKALVERYQHLIESA